MTEPLSIASSTLAVITAVSRTTSIVYKFIRDCKGAREDLTQITGELSELTLILKLIKDESAASTNDLLPNAIQIQVQAMLTGCTISVRRIEKVLAKCRGSSGPLRWTVLEKEKVTALKSSLEAFKGGLSLALETLNLSMTREIKNNTKMIQDNTTEIKHDTTEILDEIYRLRNQLLPGAPSDQERLRLEQWLDNLTHYAETIVASNETDAEIDEDSDVASFFEGVQEQSQPDDDAAAEPSTSITSRTGTAGAGNEIPVQHGGERLSSKEGLIDLDGDQPTLPKKPPPETDNSATKGPRLPRPSNNGRNEIPHHIIDSKPCSSGILSGDYCKSLDIWATIHKDSILRLWSPLRREALVSLLVLQDGLDDLSADAVDLTFDNMALQFCPAKPELILIELPCHKVEVWDWKQKAKIKMAPEARKMFKESRTRVNFVPRTTLIYAHDSKKYLMIVDLITPLRFEMISISHLTKQAHFRYMWFVSDSEILMIQEPSAASFKRALIGKVFSLPLSPIEGVPTSARYNQELFRRVFVTAKYRFLREVKSESEIYFDHKRRRLAFLHSWQSHALGFKRGIQTKLISLDIYTGAKLFQWHYPCALESLFCPLGCDFVVLDNTKRFKGYEVVCVEDGLSMGTISRSWAALSVGSNGKIALLRHVGSHIEFAMTDVRLDELAGVPMKW